MASAAQRPLWSCSKSIEWQRQQAQWCWDEQQAGAAGSVGLLLLAGSLQAILLLLYVVDTENRLMNSRGERVRGLGEKGEGIEKCTLVVSEQSWRCKVQLRGYSQ